MTKSSVGMKSAPFIASQASVAQVMRQVIYAMLPGIGVYIGFYGWGVLLNIFFAVVSALLFEAAMLGLRQRPIAPFLSDGSAIVTAILLALALPPMLPWWLPVVGSFFAIVVAKQLYGGLGYNSFNPAMAAYAVLLISFPREMSVWSMSVMQQAHQLSFADYLAYAFFGSIQGLASFDTISSATVLDHIRTGVGLGQPMEVLQQSPAFGLFAGYGSEWVSLAFLLGGLWLMIKKIISWHIPLALMISLSLIASMAYWLNPSVYSSPLLQLFAGATILGAFFIATDPVTASTTPRGRLLYGAGIGLLTFAIRHWGGYPDGIAFAVLLMGMLVPLIDHYTVPRVYGARSKPNQ